MLESRERFPSTQRLRPELSIQDRIAIEEMGLRHVLYVPEFRANMGLLTALAERWHSETCTFHLPMGEMTVTLEDVYRILHIPIDGELIPYDRDGDGEALRRVFQDPGLEMRAGHVAWDTMTATGLALPAVIGGAISGFLCPNRPTRGLAVGWGGALETLVTEHTRYAWGPCVLAHLYYELHQFVYHGSVGLGCRVTLLQVWAYEHLPITRPIHFRGRGQGRSFVHLYDMITSQPRIGRLEHWRRVIDDIDIVIWRLYLGCEEWEDDAVELPYTFRSRYLIGRMPYILERQLVDRVGRQFGRIQRMPRSLGMYARTVRDQAQFRPLLSYDQAVTQMTEMLPLPWDMWLEVEDAGMDTEYAAYWGQGQVQAPRQGQRQVPVQAPRQTFGTVKFAGSRDPPRSIMHEYLLVNWLASGIGEYA
ncbi:protein MAINTENANCE OF MERISTEMS-like [Cryptomeria japonica]|uniref:protein MAINTENANCE OF MERISTEMS-like n=1 Tax=Cryptomeria japonica TaxID=3369 RepID=UPI0027DAA251|nr:protein MAINTENANCE OF MERISTEMS-like [Cryptomeria japonica]